MFNTFNNILKKMHQNAKALSFAILPMSLACLFASYLNPYQPHPSPFIANILLYAAIAILSISVIISIIDWQYFQILHFRIWKGNEITNKDATNKYLSRHAKKYPLILIGLMVSLFAAGGAVDPAMKLLTSLGLQQSIAYTIVLVACFITTIAWYNLYTEGSDGMLNVFTKTTAESKEESNIESTTGNVLGWFNAAIANTTGLIIGAIGVFTDFTPGFVNAAIGWKIAIIALAAAGGFFAAAALTRVSLIKFFSQIENDDKRSTLLSTFKSPTGALKLIASIVTSIGVAAFNFKAALYCIPAITKLITNTSLALNSGMYILASIAGLLTFFAVTALLIRFNFSQVFEAPDTNNSSSTPPKIQNLIINTLALFCDSLQVIMLYDAIKSILPKAVFGYLARQIIAISFAACGGIIFFTMFKQGLEGFAKNFTFKTDESNPLEKYPHDLTTDAINEFFKQPTSAESSIDSTAKAFCS